jgi:hypothetical protein
MVPPHSTDQCSVRAVSSARIVTVGGTLPLGNPFGLGSDPRLPAHGDRAGVDISFGGRPLGEFRLRAGSPELR